MTTHVNLGFYVGQTFPSFTEFKEALDQSCKKNLVRFWKRDSRTIESARKTIKRFLKTDLEYYQLKYACYYSEKNKKANLKKKKQRIKNHLDNPCAASISLRASESGDLLEICHINQVHNHPINEDEYQKICKKKKTTTEALLNDSDADIPEEAISNLDKFKIIVKKCRVIAKISSVSNSEQLDDIVDNLDNYIAYLEYHLSKEESESNQQTFVNEDNSNFKTSEKIEVFTEETEV